MNCDPLIVSRLKPQRFLPLSPPAETKEAGLKIDDALNSVAAMRSRETRKSKGNTPPTATPNHGSASDSVEITSASAQLSKLEEELGQIDSTDTAKVEAVRQTIADGNFQVDEEVVADALVQSTMEQLRRQGNTSR